MLKNILFLSIQIRVNYVLYELVSDFCLKMLNNIMIISNGSTKNKKDVKRSLVPTRPTDTPKLPKLSTNAIIISLFVSKSEHCKYY